MAFSLYDLSALVFIAISLEWGIHLFSPLLFIALLHLSKLIHDRYDKKYHQAAFVSQPKPEIPLETSKNEELDGSNDQISTTTQNSIPKKVTTGQMLLLSMLSLNLEDLTESLQLDCSLTHLSTDLMEKLSRKSLDLGLGDDETDIEMQDVLPNGILYHPSRAQTLFYRRFDFGGRVYYLLYDLKY